MLVLILVVVGMATAVSHRATVQNPASPAADGDIYLPIVTKPGTPPPQIVGCDIFPGDNIWNTPD